MARPISAAEQGKQSKPPSAVQAARETGKTDSIELMKAGTNHTSSKVEKTDNLCRPSLLERILRDTSGKTPGSKIGAATALYQKGTKGDKPVNTFKSSRLS
ncbi:hypothetical protein PTTG_26210 [Puccinia triticina 1-1 BBBD Race 1]|uniref:Uncharacterized protein n=1 Tax=Puccinia triticina (isolate 1-1 / race 1 (BBBD)) TaxID=630390 RepID=A0A180GWU2_PUCT1|nr:hypothetical protein PTTG_26210 [Puccinia triticina 1-1 BBBD Race 1]